ncbi:glycosyltransferase [Capillimicrobium parvum]|uniref:UDP-N-acetylglucosamine--peptide N-acetylglucosaminyltransferase GtfA subunit n=1 Tax=Capillimicrobium parvum TaxID=2884022 RepID=A0A9E6XVU0_9ACTN|nr:glycosyltransferase [Capillimicrobium parvum]UGS35390.1 UDP-N-acetylglucosamine--peptide N-acetylglucosaminyltransferase GtfA subunit [Capillimicrobium parvum]
MTRTPTGPQLLRHGVAMGLLRAAAHLPRRRAQGSGPPKVHLLLLNAWGMGGTIRATLDLAGRLAEHHDVEVISLLRRRERPFFAFPPGVTVTALDDRRPGAPPRGGLARRLLASRPSHLMHPADRRAATCSLWTDLVLARRLLALGDGGVLIATRPGLNLVGAAVARPGLPTVGQEHMHRTAHATQLQRAMTRWYPRLDAVVTLTERDRAAHAAALGDPAAVVCIPNAGPPVAEPPAQLSEPVIVAAGRLTAQKAFGRLVRAFAIVAEHHPGWTLRIYGEGPQRPALERMIRDRGLTGRVQLMGRTRDLHGVLAGASVLALSSRFEGMPLVILEAFAAGVPVVSFDCPTGPGELIENGSEGLLVPDGDVRALGAALRLLAGDEPQRRRMGRAARVRAARQGPAAVTERWEALLRRLAPARPAERPAPRRVPSGAPAR